MSIWERALQGQSCWGFAGTSRSCFISATHHADGIGKGEGAPLLGPHGLETNPRMALLGTPRSPSPLQTTKLSRWRLQCNQDTRDEVGKALHAYLVSWEACQETRAHATGTLFQSSPSRDAQIELWHSLQLERALPEETQD